MTWIALTALFAVLNGLCAWANHSAGNHGSALFNSFTAGLCLMSTVAQATG